MISNLDLLSSSETYMGLSWNKKLKKHLSDWAQCQETIGGTYFTKKWRAETLQAAV